MPLYRATLSALMSVSASSQSSAERNARSDGAEFVSQNEHDLQDIGEASPDDEETTSFDDISFEGSAEPSDDDDDPEADQEIAWDAVCTFDVVFQADDIRSAREIAIGIPYRISCMDDVSTVVNSQFDLGEPYARTEVDKIYVPFGENNDEDLSVAILDALTARGETPVSVTRGEDAYVVTIAVAPGLEPAAAPAP